MKSMSCVACFRSLLAFPWSKVDFVRSASHSLSSNLLGSIQRNQLDNENSTDRDCMTCQQRRIYVSASPSTTTYRVPKLTLRMDRHTTSKYSNRVRDDCSFQFHFTSSTSQSATSLLPISFKSLAK